MAFRNRGYRQFSDKEKKAYHLGEGYGIAKHGKRVENLSDDEKKSFRNGFNKAKSQYKNK